MNKVFRIIIPLLLFTSCINQKEPPGADLQVGDKIPAFTIELNDGRLLSHSDFLKGSWLICFFNTSCPDCRKELYNLQLAIHNSQLVCIAREQSAESIERYWKENGLTLPYSAQTDRAIYNLFATRGIPRIYITQDGIITKAYDDIY